MRLVLLALVLFAVAPTVSAYREDTRQALTFLAAKRFNRCVEGTEIPRLSALEVRNLVRGNVAEGDRNWLRSATRWNYYDREDRDDRRLLWAIETRFHERFDALGEHLRGDEAAGASRYEDLGVLVHYVQTVTIPADVVPIFHPRPWRWPAWDRFTNYDVGEEALAARLGPLCAELLATPADASFTTILDRTAAATMAAIRRPIADMDATWNVFWQEDEPGRFGSYGPAGNSFGRAARFPCGDETCHLLDDDPIYRDFAVAQRRLAVLATMRAVLVMQRLRAEEAGDGDDDVNPVPAAVEAPAAATEPVADEG
jgi:hypothetical protein